MVTKKKIYSLKKHDGLHHKKNTHYIKIYWPYIPLLLLSVIGFNLFLSGDNRSKSHVLSYSTTITDSALLNNTNTQRIKNNQPLLNINNSLTKAAQQKADDMNHKNYWSHVTPEGFEPWYFIKNNNYSYYSAGENLAYGFSTSEDVINAWMNSPEHKYNILNPQFKDVGIGISQNNNYQYNGRSIIVVMLYADPMATIPRSGKVLGKITTRPTINDNNIAPLKSVSVLRAPLLNENKYVALSMTILGTVAILTILLRHSLNLRRKLLNTESYIKHHPFVDICSVLIIVIIGVFTQIQGFIQ
ncbi:MAG: hypothetical protein NVSMB46_06760 [Candidatus Saccharimonadales bacterium]